MLSKLKACFGGSRREDDPEFQNWLNEAEEMTRSISNAEISITVADPAVDDCPLIGISTGFTRLTGYHKEDILGRNCRFLVDGAPEEERNKLDSERKKARIYCQACQKVARNGDGIEPGPPDVCIFQVNGRKDRTRFFNMFLLHFIRLNGRPLIVGLQQEIPYITPQLIDNLRAPFLADQKQNGHSHNGQDDSPETPYLAARMQGNMQAALKCLLEV